VLIAQRRAASQLLAASLPDLDPLLQFLERQLQTAAASGWVERMIELLTLQALAWQAQNNIAEALGSLQRALALAQPGGYVRLFVDEGQPMRRLLARLKHQGGRMTEYIGRLLAAGGETEAFQPSTFTPQPLVEPLSARELEVLRLLAAGDSNAEIAQKLVITLNTTKKHITHIFEKLAVTNRAEAVARAQELGLVVYPIR
jgi:LuxR family maltose regulon positive regulatory protein